MATTTEINAVARACTGKLEGWYLADFLGDKQSRLIYVAGQKTIVFIVGVSGRNHFRSLKESKDYYKNWIKVADVKIGVN